MSGRVWMWNAITGEHLLYLELNSLNRASSCVFTGDGQVLMAGMLESLVLIDTYSHEVLAQLGLGGLCSEAPFDGVRSIGVHCSNGWFVAGDSQSLLTCISLQTYESVGTASIDSPPSGIVVLDDGRVIVAEETGQLSQFDAYLDRRTVRPSGRRCWALAASSTHAFTGHQGGGIARWTLDALDPPVWVASHTGDVETLQILADGRVLASGGRDGRVRFWKVDDWSFEFELVFPDAVENLSLSKDGATLLVSLSRGALICIDLHGFYF